MRSIKLHKLLDLVGIIPSLDLIDHDFYVFRNKKNNELQDIYKRNHGGYGLIQSK